MAKRSADDMSPVIPDGFKDLNGKIVCEEYKQIDLDSVEVNKYYLKTHPKDNALKKVTAYIQLDAFDEDDRDWLKAIDSSLSNAAKLVNAKHCPLVKGDEVKVTGNVKLGKKKMIDYQKNKTDWKMNINGTFMLTSVYNMKPTDGDASDQGYYGINLFGNASNARTMTIDMIKVGKVE